MPSPGRCKTLGLAYWLLRGVHGTADLAGQGQLCPCSGALRRATGCALAQQLTRCAAGCTLGPAARCTWKVRMTACGLSQELRLITTQTRGLTDYGVKCGNPVVLFLEPKMLRYTHCETSNCRRMRRNCVSPHALKDYSLTYHTDGHGVRTILTSHT